MSNLQMIEALCDIAEQLCRIVRGLSAKLEQIDALDEEEKRAVAGALAKYNHTLGANEIPDEFAAE